MPSTKRATHLLLAVLLTIAVACQGKDNTTHEEPPAPSVAASADSGGDALSAEELGNTAYAGVYSEPVQLSAGQWQGAPFVADGASRPRVELLPDLQLRGDLTGDGAEEVAVLLSESSGGSGSNTYLAVVGRKGHSVVNLGTALVGDRVQIREAHLEDGRVELDVIQQGPDDAACCPSQKATRAWSLGTTGLVEVSTEVTGALSLSDLEGVEWLLVRFSRTEDAPREPEITLVFQEGRISGRSGCNQYFAEVETGETPSELVLSKEIGSTMMACPPDQMELEQRYLKALGSVRGFSFLTGTLVLTYVVDEVYYGLVFMPRVLAENGGP